MAEHSLREVSGEHGRRTPSWTDSNDPLLHFVHEADMSDVPIDDIIGAHSVRSDDTLTIPLIFQYSRSTRRTFYRRGEVMAETHRADAEWLELDPHTSLKSAFDRYGWENILAYEKVVQHSALEIIVMPFRTKHSQTLRVLVRKNRKARP